MWLIVAGCDIMDCVYAKEDFKVFHRIPTHAPMSVFELAVLAESLRAAAGSYSSDSSWSLWTSWRGPPADFWTVRHSQSGFRCYLFPYEECKACRTQINSHPSAAGNSNSFTAQAGDDSPTHIRIPRPSLFQSPTNLFQNSQHLKSEFIINFEYLKGSSLWN